MQTYPEMIEGKQIPVIKKKDGKEGLANLLESAKSKVLVRSNYKESKEPSQIGFVRNPENDGKSQISVKTKSSRARSQ